MKIAREPKINERQQEIEIITYTGETMMKKKASVMQRAAKMLVLFLLTGVLTATGANAAIIGVDFDDNTNANSGGGGSMAAGDSAGVISAANWTTVTSAGLTSNLQDSTGTATTLDITSITTSSSSPFFIGQANDGFTMSPDLKMMGDTVGVNGNGGVFLNVALAEIPFSIYDLYVYVGTDVNTNRGGSVTTDNSSTTFFYKGSNVLNSYVQATETGSHAASGTANYVLFEGLSGSSLTITSEAIVEQTFITGFQIVEIIPVVPEPSTFLLLGLGALGLVRHNRRRRRKV